VFEPSPQGSSLIPKMDEPWGEVPQTIAGTWERRSIPNNIYQWTPCFIHQINISDLGRLFSQMEPSTSSSYVRIFYEEVGEINDTAPCPLSENTAQGKRERGWGGISVVSLCVTFEATLHLVTASRISAL
jgi:hypothetical protein